MRKIWKTAPKNPSFRFYACAAARLPACPASRLGDYLLLDAETVHFATVSCGPVDFTTVMCSLEAMSVFVRVYDALVSSCT